MRVDFRRNRAKPARDRSWSRQYQEHEFLESDTERVENVQTKGDLSRRRTVQDDPGAELPEGKVLAMRGLIAEVEVAGRVYPCTVRRVLRTRLIRERHPVTVGDLVRITLVQDESGPSPRIAQQEAEIQGVIECVEPRHGCLTRRYANRTQTLAANVDQAVIITSAAQPYCKPHLIDRYLVAAHAGKILPIICFNKIDLDVDGQIPEIAERYESLGYQTLRTSAVRGDGIDSLSQLLAGRTSVIVGQSGVGKSSLLNAMQPGLNLRVGEVSSDTEKGTHTTTTAELRRLDVGGYVVDTPGIKTLELADVDRNELEMYFVDVEKFVAGCKFPDCTHTHEGECAVKQAVEEGRIHPDRYESYLRLFEGED